MKTKNSCIISNLLHVVLLLSAVHLPAYEWPQIVNGTAPFHSYFGQSRGTTFGNSLIFSEPGTVSAVDSGRLLAVLESGTAEMGWFEPALGNAVIITHGEQMLTVYGNLESVYVAQDTSLIESGLKLGTSGESGWQKGKSCLEFQVIDTKNKTSINPLILMPRTIVARKSLIGTVTAVNRKGESIDLTQRKTLPAGTYLFYQELKNTVMPYKTTVSINGAEVESITYDVLKQCQNRLCVIGKRQYTFDAIFAPPSRQLLTEVMLTAGKNTVTITASNFLGEESSAIYILDIQ
jgi:hypothetical protein